MFLNFHIIMASRVCALPNYRAAEELIKLNIKSNHRIITLDINDLYTNLPTKGIIEATIHWLGQSTVSKGEKQQIIPILVTIVQQNYFQYNNLYYIPTKGVAMGSPLSGNLAELYLQYLEKIYIKHWINSREIYFYTTYVDDILVIYEVNLVTEQKISQHFNEIDSNLKFKLTTENNKCISFLDLGIQRKPDKITVGYIQERNKH